jgi:hypothetical protein
LKKGETGTMWLQDLLPDKIPQARVMTFGYNADMINNYSTSNIRDHARKLLSLLRDKRDEEEVSSAWLHPPRIVELISIKAI